MCLIVRNLRLTIILFRLSLLVMGQDLARPDKLESEKSRQERQFDEEGREKILTGKKTSLDYLREENSRYGKFAVRSLRFTKSSSSGFDVTITANYDFGGGYTSVADKPRLFGYSPMDLSPLEKYVAKDELIVYEGDVPRGKPEWNNWLRDHPNYVLASGSSPNKTFEQKINAISLAERIVNRDNLIIFNCLPRELQTVRSDAERKRMGILGSRQDWEFLNQEITKSIGLQFETHSANKISLIDHLKNGSRDIVIIFSHTSNEKLYLPGADGGSISLHDLDDIKQGTAPDRIVVLVACNGGILDKPTPSFAEIILRNNLARSVFAYDDLFDARKIPEIVRKLQTNDSLRHSLVPLRQIVGAAEGKPHSHTTDSCSEDHNHQVLTIPKRRDSPLLIRRAS